MKVEMTACDQCGRLAKDYMAEKGWIVFDGGNVTVTNGRENGNSGNAKSLAYLNHSSSSSTHLCGLVCLLKKLKLDDPRIMKILERRFTADPRIKPPAMAEAERKEKKRAH